MAHCMIICSQTKLIMNLLKKFSYSIINGLNHLHTEIIGSSERKPQISHRDIKSKNILIKNTFECCIADFGLAVRYNSLNQSLDLPSNKLREGSIRIMAPEILDETLDYTLIDELKRTDIYAYALVIWELIKSYCDDAQADANGSNEELYSAPYSEYLTCEPTVDEMKVIVCDRKLRPTLTEWKKRDKVSCIHY